MADGKQQPDLKTGQFKLVDSIANRFEAAWRESVVPPSIVPFLADVSGSSRLALLEELVRIDQHFRQKQGEPRPFADYLADFPELLELNDTNRVNATVDHFPASDAVLASEPPSKIGKYVVVRELGSGGQATVYRAIHPNLGKDVVIKLIHAPVRTSPAERDALLAEGRILADLDVPHLARVYDFDLHEGRPYLVMEYVPGLNLNQYHRQHPLEPAEMARLLAKVARAVGKLHRLGVIHQDLKPQNILVDPQGEPCVIDLGVARLRHAWFEDNEDPGTISGTIQFMAPEQARGETDSVNAQSDVFSLGAVLYWYLVGKAPFALTKPSSWREVLELARSCNFDLQALNAAPMPDRLKTICVKAMAVKQTDRYSTGEALAKDLDAFSGSGARARAWSVALGVGVLVAVLAVTGWRFGWLEPNASVEPSLTVRVYRNQKWYDTLEHILPLKTGDELKFRLQPPGGLKLSFFGVDGAGHMRSLDQFDAPQAGGEVDFPGRNLTLPIEGPGGTELLLVCGVRDGNKITNKEIESLWEDSGQWPELPMESVLRVTPDNIIKSQQKTRSFAEPVERADPENEVRKRLNNLRNKLHGRVDYLEGLAFSHAE